jgi:uncharacterized membrane protein
MEITSLICPVVILASCPALTGFGDCGVVGQQIIPEINT